MLIRTDIFHVPRDYAGLVKWKLYDLLQEAYMASSGTIKVPWKMVLREETLTFSQGAFDIHAVLGSGGQPRAITIVCNLWGVFRRSGIKRGFSCMVLRFLLGCLSLLDGALSDHMRKFHVNYI